MKNYIEGKTVGNSKVYGEHGGKANSKMMRDGGQIREKINIFDQKDPNLLKREALDRIGYEENAVVPIGLRSASTLDKFGHESSRDVVPHRPASGKPEKPKALQYMDSFKNEKRETAKEYVDLSRQILMKEIEINQKKESCDRLREYVTLEQEKLEEAKKFLQQDRE